MAIAIPSNGDEAAHVVALSALISVSVSLVTLFLISICGPVFSEYTGELQTYLYLLPVGIVFASIYRILRFLSIREKHYFSISKTKVVQSTSSVLIQVLGYKWGLISLLLGNVISQSAGSVSLIKANWSYLKSFNIERVKLISVAKRYVDFPKYSSASALMSVASVHMPTILLATLYSPMIAGFYSLANRAVASPMSVLSRAISDVFLSKAGRKTDLKVLRLLAQKTVLNSVSLSLYPFILFFFYCDDVFALVFGAEWLEAASISKVLLPWLFLVFIVSPLTVLYSVLELQRNEIVFQLVLFIFRTVSLLIGLKYDYKIAINAFAISSAMLWYIQGLFLIHKLNINRTLFHLNIGIIVLKNLSIILPIILSNILQIYRLEVLALTFIGFVIIQIKDKNKLKNRDVDEQANF